MHEKSPGAEHRRTVVVLKPHIVLVLDALSSTETIEHEYELLYHLPPAAEIDQEGSSALVVVGDAALGLTVAASGVTTSTIREGEEDPLFGWVTRGNARREPAPVLSFVQSGDFAWYATVIHAQKSDDPTVPVAEVNLVGDTYEIIIRSAGEHWQVRLHEAGTPSILRSP